MRRTAYAVRRGRRRRKLTFRDFQNFADGKLIRRTVEPIAAALAAHADEHVVLHEQLDDAFQIFFGKSPGRAAISLSGT